MITKLHVQNFKCLRDVSVELRPFTVLIGKNDTGKSSLLEAIQMLGGLVQATPEPPVAPVDRLTWRGSDPSSLSWTVEVATSGASLRTAVYSLRISQSARYPGGIHVDGESFTAAGSDASIAYDREATGTWLRVHEHDRDLAQHLESVRRTALSIAGTEQGLPTFKAMADALKTSDVFRFDASHLAEPAAYDTPSILLIEEPENGIHPGQLQRVAGYLKRLTDPARGKDAVQIVTATHSPYFLDFVPPEDVLVFGRKASGETVVRPLLSLPGVKERLASGFSLGEMWFNVGEDRLLGEALGTRETLPVARSGGPVLLS
jgi:predicted ATP-binding protein involved in virulence